MPKSGWKKYVHCHNGLKYHINMIALIQCSRYNSYMPLFKCQVCFTKWSKGYSLRVKYTRQNECKVRDDRIFFSVADYGSQTILW